MRQSAALAAALALTLPAAAQAFEAVTDRDLFLSLVEGRELRLWIFDISLTVLPDGRISGEAQGAPITGNWEWQDGLFCREMAWGETPIPYNCQLVEANGAAALRFTVDAGAGESATFALR